MRTPVEVPLIVYEGLQKINAAGTDMNNYYQVLSQAEELRNPVLLSWLRTNMKYYLQSTYYGLVSDPGDNT